MGDRDWFTSYARSIGMLLNGHVMREWAETGELLVDDALLVLLNAFWEPVPFTLPKLGSDAPWRVLLDTARPDTEEQEYGQRAYSVGARSLALLALPVVRAGSLEANASPG